MDNILLFFSCIYIIASALMVIIGSNEAAGICILTAIAFAILRLE